MLPSEQVRKDIKELQRKISCCSKDDLICLNEQETFTPVDPLNPTQEEVSAWAAQYLDACQLRGSTYLSYYQPAYQVPEDIITFNFPFGTANIIITTFTFNGDVLTPAPPIEVTDAISAVTYISNTITDIFDGWLSSQLGLSAFVGETTFTTDGVLTFYDIAGNFEVTIEGTSEGVPFTFTGSTIRIPQEGTCNEPTHVWATATEEIIQLLSPTQISNREYFVATDMTYTWDTGFPGAPPIGINTNKDTLLFEHQNGFVEYKSDITGTTWEKQTYHPYTYYPNTIFITTEGSENPTVGYLERAFSNNQLTSFMIGVDWTLYSEANPLNIVLLSGNGNVVNRVDSIENPHLNIIIPEYSSITSLNIEFDGMGFDYIPHINVYCDKNIGNLSGVVSSSDVVSGYFNINFKNIDYWNISVTLINIIKIIGNTIYSIESNISNVVNVYTNINKLNIISSRFFNVDNSQVYNYNINIGTIINVGSNLITNILASQGSIFYIDIKNIENLAAVLIDSTSTNRTDSYFINIENILTINSYVINYTAENNASITIGTINHIDGGGIALISSYQDNPSGYSNMGLDIKINRILDNNNGIIINTLKNDYYHVNINIGEINMTGGSLFIINDQLEKIKYVNLHVDRYIAKSNAIGIFVNNKVLIPFNISGVYGNRNSAASIDTQLIYIDASVTESYFNFINFYVYTIFQNNGSGVEARHSNSCFKDSAANVDNGFYNSNIGLYII